MDLSEVNELLEALIRDKSLSKNIREILTNIKEELRSEDVRIKIDAALQRVEDLSLDPNISTYTRTQIWNLTSLLETAQND